MLLLSLQLMRELMTPLLHAQQQPDELIALFLGKVQLIAEGQLADQRLGIKANPALHVSD